MSNTLDEALLEIEELHKKLQYQLEAHEAVVHSNSVLRSIIDKQSEEIHKLRNQIHNEGAGKA